MEREIDQIPVATIVCHPCVNVCYYWVFKPCGGSGGCVCVCLRSCHPCVTCVFVTNVPTMRCVCVYVYALKIVCLVVCGSALAGSVL